MKKRSLLLVLVVSISTLVGFVGTTRQGELSKKDVKINIPQGFPAPVYDFKNNPISPAGVELGRKLFYDPLLSRDSTISCQSCHQRVAAFAHIDHALSHGIYSKIGTRNVPSLENMIWNTSFMWDGGVNNLEVQPINPITNPIEMDMPLNMLIHKLQSSQVYPLLFKKAFKDTAVTSERILKALAQFTGLMISANSRYDRYLAGKDTFSIQEKNGLAVFRARCSSCHREPLFTDNSFRNNGIPPDSSLNDTGREKITHFKEDLYKFKVPSLRNIEMTFPYMHDGRYKKLKDVLAHYSGGEKNKNSNDPDLDKIGVLTDKDRKDIIAFLLTLTDRNFLNDQRFRDPAMMR